MSTFFNKFFTGASSSTANADLGSMESLCTAINHLSSGKEEAVGERAAEIVRQNKDLFEKKCTDVEAFLLHCSPLVGSAAMVAAIKGMFDASAAKNNETGQERAVELLHHYVDENNFVGEHLKLVPEIIFPLLRNIGTYCLEKKNKPDIGQKIITKALESMYPRNGSGPKVLTSAHSVLFTCALKTKDYASVEPFIDVQIDEIANENGVHESTNEEQSAMFNIGRVKKNQTSPANNAPSQPFLNPKFVLDYLYNGACILIELKRFDDALFLLETLVAIPAFTIQEQHIDGYKKFVLLSLLLNGKVIENTDKVSGTRNLKGKTSEYKTLAEVRFSRSSNTHTKVDELVQNARDKLRKDGNLELAKLVVLEMKKKTIISLTKMFTSIKLSEIQGLAFLKNRAQVIELIDMLVTENRIAVNFDGDMVFWSEVTPVPTKENIETKIRTVDYLNQLLQERNKDMKSGAGRQRPSVLFNDDEGLSMPPVE
ncbi:hypothetical protein GCK72_014645 [Caenorhabditis remanei]|uniref:COP9 signalosome complex subunit 3 N-terminal helical repeats domain-containing protein n=3 Tax=Caenorhabditis remanei TaxID=31234 RepID=A0A6A5GSN5_CAERE|nr:hypothetical protein GCK72_014645 [Caenorhabditis remanei]KAF1758187.1 hypothetical protein GCK72_014645 [Caenorhabditis remanei]